MDVVEALYLFSLFANLYLWSVFMSGEKSGYSDLCTIPSLICSERCKGGSGDFVVVLFVFSSYFYSSVFLPFLEE